MQEDRVRTGHEKRVWRCGGKLVHQFDEIETHYSTHNFKVFSSSSGFVQSEKQ